MNENLARNGKQNGNYKHGLRATRQYRIWLQMKNRCYNLKTERYKDYGARGIKVCDEWLTDFKAFHDWSISNGYEDDLTIDRIDNDGNYEPSNCRWATRLIQSRNARSNCLITFNGKTHCISEWAEITGITRVSLNNRINVYNWSIERALTTPVRNHKKYINSK